MHERVVVEQQRVLLRRRAVEVPDLAVEEVVVLQVDPELPRRRGRTSRSAARRHVADLVVGRARCACDQRACSARVALGASRSTASRGVPQVLPRHQVGVGVVVDDGGVLVGPGHAVDAELAVLALGEEPQVVPTAARSRPASRRRSSSRNSTSPRDLDVLPQRVGDVGVDVVLRGAGRVVGGGLLAVDRPPREQSAPLADSRARRARVRRACRSGSISRSARDLRVGVDEERQDVDLRVPEVVALVAVAGQPLGRNAVALARARWPAGAGRG